jgi:mannose-1-phosphate guanylyltransferase
MLRPAPRALATMSSEAASGRPALWGIVLAGGDGVRLRSLTRWVTGDGRPKQFCDLTGNGSLLQETIQRISRLIPPDRQLVSLTRGHAVFYEPVLARCPAVTKVVQPANRGTALGVLYPALHVATQDPEGTVAIFPSDHFVSPTDRFMDAVARAAAVVNRHPHTLALLGVVPSSPEPEYGWIEPGEPLGVDGIARHVSRFLEKPRLELAQQLLQRGWLWNTLVVVAKVDHLIRLALSYVPDSVAPLLAIRSTLWTPDEVPAAVRAYAAAPPANFSRDLLERAHESLSVLELEGVTWSDWGTPGRVLSTLVRLGERPAWMTAELVRKELAHVDRGAGVSAWAEEAGIHRARLGA